MRKTVDVLIEQADLTVEQMVKATGLGRDRIEAIGTGRWLPSPRERQLVAGVLGVTVDDVAWGHTMSPRIVRYRRFGLLG